MPKKKPSFEQNLLRVQEISALLSSGQLSLEEMMQHYKEACELLASSRAMLEQAEVKLIEITDAAQLESLSVEDENE